MMLTALLVPVPVDLSPVCYRPAPAIHNRSFVRAPTWPQFEVGTGGVAGASLIRHGFGYQRFVVLEPLEPAGEAAPYAKLMQQVKVGFGRTMSRLPEVFSVSRQTLYNWLDGGIPKLMHRERLAQLADAAGMFTEMGFKPTPVMLDRPLAKGKSFLQLLAAGEDGRETAKKLIRVVQRGHESRTKLDELLVGRTAQLTASDIGAPALDEDA